MRGRAAADLSVGSSHQPSSRASPNPVTRPVVASRVDEDRHAGPREGPGEHPRDRSTWSLRKGQMACHAATTGWSTAAGPTWAAPPGEPSLLTSSLNHSALIG